MAQRTQVTLIDDRDGSEAAETVTFSLRGNHFAVDLSKLHIEELEDALAPFIAAGRPVAAPAARPRDRSPAARQDSKDARAWLKTQPEGATLPDKGRIPVELLRKWAAAGKPRVPAGSASPAFKAPSLG